MADADVHAVTAFYLFRSREQGNSSNAPRAGYTNPMNSLPRFTHIVAPALVLLLLPAQGPDNRDVDPPSRVARLSVFPAR
jgi:hypothetical protein